MIKRMSSKLSNKMDDYDAYKLSMKVIVPVDAIEAFIAKFNQSLASKFSRKLTSLVTRKPKNTYMKQEDNILAKNEVWNNVSFKIYQPNDLKEDETTSAIIWCHGGYWLIYDVEDYDQLMYTLSNRTRSLVASIDYKKSPEFKYPTALNEIYDVTKYLIQNTQKYNIDAKRIAIAGDSTGGNMATALTHKLRMENIDLKLLCLINPPLQFVDFTLPSYQQNEPENFFNILSYSGISRIIHEYVGVDVPVAHLASNSHTSEKFKELLNTKGYLSWDLLPEKYKNTYKSINKSIDKPSLADDSLLFNENVSPLLASDETLKKNPNTYILTCEYDPWRDDGLIYGERLKRLGVTTIQKHYDTGYHGALNLYQSNDFKLPKIVFEEIINFLKENL
jgi:arylacetamide deacetylase-like 3/4